MLTENAIKIIENAIGITGLQEIINSTEAQDIAPKKTKHFPEQDFNIMVENLKTEGLTPEKYTEAKKTGEEMSVKELKRKKGFEFEGKSIEALAEYYEKQIESKSKTEISEIEKQYKTDLEQMKKQLMDKESKIEQIANQRKTDKINWEVDNHFNSIQMDIPIHLKEQAQIDAFIKNEREKNKTYFKSLHQFDVDENGNILIKGADGQIIKDELLVPVKIENKVKEFAAQNFINYGQQVNKGRGGKDEFPGNNNLLSGVKNWDDLDEYAKKNKIVKNTSEYDALTTEFLKNNKT